LVIARAVADASRDGVILCDAGGRVLHRNAVATQLLGSTHSSDDLESALLELCTSAIESGEATEVPLNGWFVSASAANSVGIVTIFPRPPLPSENALRTRFGFSLREAQVAVLLAERRTDAEIATRLGISWHTVRSHVERIFSRLDCHTRRDAADKLRSA